MKVLSAVLVMVAIHPDPAQEGRTVTGVVKFQGEAPKSKAYKISCPHCAPLYPQGLTREDLVIDKGGGIRGAFVTVTAGLEGKTVPVPEEPVVVEMKGCRYEPHVLGVRAGQKIRFRNQAPHNHCVHAITFANRGLNVAIQPGQEFEKAFDKAEVMVRLKDDVYPWMSAWIGVVDHPFFAVTGPDGRFEIKGLPPGDYTLEVWQEKCAPATQRIKVGEKGIDPLEFRLGLKKE